MNGEFIQRINRSLAIQRYCELTGRYAKLCSVSRTFKADNGRYHIADQAAYDSFMAYITPMVKSFCGKFFDDGSNPDWMPHPLAIAVHIKQGRTENARQALFAAGYGNYLPKVIANCHDHGIIKENA